MVSPNSYGSVLALLVVTYVVSVSLTETWARSLVLLMQIATVWLALHVSEARRQVRHVATAALSLAAAIAVANLLWGGEGDTSAAIVFFTSALLYVIAPLSILRAIVLQREVTLEDRAGVHVRPSRDFRRGFCFQPLRELPQPLLHHAVVIPAAGVARKRAGGLATAIIEGHDDRRSSASTGKPRVTPQRRVAGEPAHLPGHAPCQPLLEGREGTGGTELRDARHRDIATGFAAAIAELKAMREREGASLFAILSSHIDRIEQLTRTI